MDAEERQRDPQAICQSRLLTPSRLPTDKQVQAYLNWIGYPAERYRNLSPANQRSTQILTNLWLLTQQNRKEIKSA